MSSIRRLGSSTRWSDVVVYRGVAQWVEVADDASVATLEQVQQVLEQINRTLEQVGSDRTRLLQILVYLQDLADAPVLNAAWDAWVPAGHAPIRACVQAGLSGTYRVEMVISAAVED
jgi:enamine deaminase RidA (YjgF/YER057c/UK114 family)